MNNLIDISQFERNTTFYGELNLLLTVKNFDLQSIRKRYLKSVGNVSGRTGSVERRKVGTGGLVAVSLQNGEIKNNSILGKFNEPRGIAMANGKLAFSSENRVYVIYGNEIITLENDWFSYIHTVDFSPTNASKLLVSSSGYDCIFEFDIITKEKSFEWFAWENGFNKGKDPVTGKSVILTRKADEARNLEANGDVFIEIKDPKLDSLPTAKRAAFINSVVYDASDCQSVLATFFHEGSVYRINMSTGKADKVTEGLKKPHGAKYLNKDFLVTDTGRGEIVIGSGDDQKRVSFTKLSGKPDGFSGIEWVQNAVIANGVIVGLDSNRTSFVIFDHNRKLYDMVSYDSNWAIQDAVEGVLTDRQTNLIHKMV